MPVFPGDPGVTIERVRTHDRDGFEVSRISLGSHSGTHLDAPRHFFPAGATIDQFPAGCLVGRGVVVDVRRPSASPLGGQTGTIQPPDGARPAESAGSGPSAPAGSGSVLVDAAYLAEQLRAFPLGPGDMVLLWTEGAFLTEPAARLLLDAGVGLVGTDSDSLEPDEGSEGHGYPVHRLLLGGGVLLAEGLCNLEKLGPGPVMCAFLPLALVGTDGAPVRAVAWR